jgi:dihydrofolate synthase/folylpolyglutamate synthase
VPPSTTWCRASSASPRSQLLGDPQKAFRRVHVTGTNGKTSTTRLVERLLREHGLRTGRFTSPHLREARERIAVDGDPSRRRRSWRRTTT